MMKKNAIPPLMALLAVCSISCSKQVSSPSTSYRTGELLSLPSEKLTNLTASAEQKVVLESNNQILNRPFIILTEKKKELNRTKNITFKKPNFIQKAIIKSMVRNGEKTKKGLKPDKEFGKASMFLGIASVFILIGSLFSGLVGIAFFGLIASIVGLVLGIKGLKTEGKNLSIAGIVMSGLALIGYIFLITIIAIIISGRVVK